MKLIKRVLLLGLAIGMLCIPTFATENELKNSQIDLSHIADYTIVSELNTESFGLSTITGNIGVNDPLTKVVSVMGTLNGKTETRGDSIYYAQKDASDLMEQVAVSKVNGYTSGTVMDENYTPGLYKSTGDMSISNTLTLDAKGDSNALFIFDIAGSLYSKEYSRVWLINGAKPENVFWISHSSARLEANSEFNGTLIAKGDIEAKSGLKMVGRLVALNGAVKFNGIQLSVPPYEKPTQPTTSSIAIKMTVGSNKAFVNGKEVQLDVAPLIKDKRTFIPVSFVAKQLNGSTSFTTGSAGQVDIISVEVGTTSVKMKIGSSSVSITKEGVTLNQTSDVAPIIVNGRTLIPFKVLADALGAKSSYGMNSSNSAVDWVLMEK